MEKPEVQDRRNGNAWKVFTHVHWHRELVEDTLENLQYLNKLARTMDLELEKVKGKEVPDFATAAEHIEAFNHAADKVRKRRKELGDYYSTVDQHGQD